MKKYTLEKVMGVSIILVLTLLIVGCPSSGSSDDTSTPASAGMCENGTPTPSTTDDAAFCTSCNDGFGLSNNSCVSETLDTDGDTVPDLMDVDDDNDGLIEISSLEMLHNMRFDLAGSSYKTSASGSGNTEGAPASAPASGAINNCNAAGLCGYELTSNLDFDGSDADDTTWTGGTAGADSTFTLDMDDNNATYFPVAAGGWLPIGTSVAPFTGIFEGNGFTISNLAISRNATSVGFFGFLMEGQIRNIGLVNVLATSTSATEHNIGGLVGEQSSNSSITASYTTGFVQAGDVTSGSLARVGGLVGYISTSLTASIRASYSTANVNGGSGNQDNVGGLVGIQGGSMIADSYATGAVFAGSADTGSTITDRAGGLVGRQDNTNAAITNSYATGAAASELSRGALIGFRPTGSNKGTDTDSFGFGTVTSATNTLGAPPSGITALTLTAANVDASAANDEWDTTVWNFGTTSQAPALNYADYDGSGDIYHCSNASNPPVGAILVVNCATLIPNQR